MSKPSAKSMWQPTIPINQSIYEDDTTKRAPLGTRLEVGDKVFYYAQASASVSGGIVLSNLAISGTAETLVSCTGTTGNSYLTITAGTNMTANDYAEGVLYSHTVTGGIRSYRIKSHGSIGSAGTGTVYLYDTLEANIVAADTVGIMKHPYKKVKVVNAATNVAMGVATIDVTANGYFWMQTFGPAAVGVEADGTAPAGDIVVAGTGGYLKQGGATGDDHSDTVVGKAIGIDATNIGGTAQESTLVWLTMRH